MPFSPIRHRVVLGLAAIVAAGEMLAQGPQSGDQTPTFRAATDLVQLDVSVLDRQGLPVRGLTAADFTVVEAGVSQPVTTFAEIEVPTWTSGNAAWTREVGPDVVSNRATTRRAVVIVMDDFNTRWGTAATRTAKEIGLAAIDELGPSDLAAVVYVLSRRQGQEFTVDRARLRAAVERFAPSGIPPQPESRFSASRPGAGLTIPAQLNRANSSGACMPNCVVQALRNAAELLEAWPGVRKNIILIGPGRFVPTLDTLELQVEGDPLREALAAMQRANVTVYEVDPHGLEVEFRPSIDFALYADSTGGRSIASTNAPADMIPQVFRENSSYYLLGFQPTNIARDGRFRRLEVRVNRPDVTVRTRAGYFAPSERPAAPATEPPATVEQALSGGLPSGDWPLSLTAVPFATPERPGAAVAVVARADLGADLDASEPIELVAVAFDTRWRQAATAMGRFDPPADRTLPAAEMGLRLDLAPGRYEIRVAVSSASSDRKGSVYTSITVPDFARDPVSLSGIAIAHDQGGAVLTDEASALVPVRPSAERIFAPDQRAVAAVRVYQGGRRRLEPVRVNARILDESGAVAFDEGRVLDAESFDDQRGADYTLDLPIDRLAAGEYLLTIEAVAGDASARGDVRFSVRR
jgi:VWFA-related protein